MSVVLLAGPAHAAIGPPWLDPDGTRCNGQAFILKENHTTDVVGVTRVDLLRGRQIPLTSLTYGFNAVGFSDENGYLYGSFRPGIGGNMPGVTAVGTLWQIASDGSYQQIPLRGPAQWVLPPNGTNGTGGSLVGVGANYPVGDVDDNNHYWVASKPATYMYEIDLNAGAGYGTVLNRVPITPEISISDFTYVTSTRSFFGVTDTVAGGGLTAVPHLVSISPVGVVSDYGPMANMLPGRYVGMYFTATGGAFAMHAGETPGTGGEVYRINAPQAVQGAAPVAVEVSDVGAVVNGDAAQCTVLPPQAVLKFGKIVDKTTAPHGSVLTYTINVRNVSLSDPINNFRVVDRIGAGSTYVPGSARVNGIPGGTFAPTPAPGTITWAIAQLTAGSSATLTFQVRVNPGTNSETIVNRVKAYNPPNTNPVFPPPLVVYPCADDPTTSCATTTVPAVRGQITFGKLVDKTSISPGGQLGYTVRIRNSGGRAESNVVVQDALPPGVEYVAASNGGTYADGVVTWTIPSLPIGAAVDRYLTVKAPSDVTSPEALVNKVGIVTPAGDLPPEVIYRCSDDPTRSCATTNVIPELPDTGAHTEGLAVIGLGLLLAGGGACLFGRRRSRTE